MYFSSYALETCLFKSFVCSVCVLSHVWLFAIPLDCSPSGFSVHGILPARILEWSAISSPGGSSQIRDWTCISYASWIVGRFWEELSPSSFNCVFPFAFEFQAFFVNSDYQTLVGCMNYKYFSSILLVALSLSW